MKSRLAALSIAVCSVALLCACDYCAVPNGFEPISDNGFEAADNAADYLIIAPSQFNGTADLALEVTDAITSP